MKIVGQPVNRKDAFEKVTGQAIYASDLAMPGMFYMKLVLAERPHARILSIDTAEAKKQPGVAAVLTARDVPVNRYGLLVADQPVLCDAEVRFVGDPVAAVVANTPEHAAHAAKLVKVMYQDLPVIENPFQAMQPAAALIHKDYPGNVAYTLRLRLGDVATGFAQADVIVEREYRTPRQEHAFLEPEAGLGYIDEQGRISVISAGQSVHDDQRQIAETLNMPLECVRVVYGPIGGSFGGREDVSVQILLALAAWKLQRPVKIFWNRRESILGHVKRHAMTLRYKWGARRDGKLVAAQIEVISDAGAYMSTSGSVLENYLFGAIGPYEIPHVHLDAKAIYTNNIPGGAFRGFGFPQSAFAAELQIAHLAEKLGIDPITMRLRNCLRDDSHFSTQSPVPGGVSLSQLIETCAREIGAVETAHGWQMPTLAGSHNKKRGLGLAVGMKNSGFSFGFPEGSEARVILHGDTVIERAELHTAATDFGQGSHSVLAQIAAEALGITLEQVAMVTSDTAVIGDSGPASASRLTLFAGNGVRQAADLALQKWQNEERPAVGECHWNAPPTTPPDPETGACVNSVSFSYGAQAVEVEVDLETGQIALLRVIAVHDPGRAVNPQQVVGQIEGGVIQAQGWALLEDFITEGGYVLTDRLSTYLIPTVLDIPTDMKTVLIEKNDPVGPFGVRGVGEIPFIPTAPAIVCAVHDALGVWFDRIPLKPEQVLTRL